MRGGGFKYHIESSLARSGFRMGFDWRVFLPEEKTKGLVIKDEPDTVSAEKEDVEEKVSAEDVEEKDISEDVKEDDVANSEELFKNLMSHISVEHNFTRLVLIL